jgi:osmoprotectant transport system permease protein
VAASAWPFGSALGGRPRPQGRLQRSPSPTYWASCCRAAPGKGPAEHKAAWAIPAFSTPRFAGSIDVYHEYSGTIAREILKLEGNPGPTELNRSLAPMGLAVAVPLGFNNTYALGVREELAARLGVNSITDLASHPDLRLGLSQEFIARKDGWPGLARAYGLASFSPTGLDHGLAYEALAGNRVDVIDTYSTDAKIARYRIRLLADDRGYFPRYDTLLLHREDTPRRFPLQWQALSALEGKIDERMLPNATGAEGRAFPGGRCTFRSALPGARRARPEIFKSCSAPHPPDPGHLLLVFLSRQHAVGGWYRRRENAARAAVIALVAGQTLRRGAPRFSSP